MYARREAIYARYQEAFGALESVQTVETTANGKHSLHLYMLLLNPEVLNCSRGEFINEARAAGVELSVNYTPVHLFSWYRSQFCSTPGAFPHAEYTGANTFSLPFYPLLSDEDVDYVIATLTGILKRHQR